MRYVRVTNSVQDKGVLVTPEESGSLITNRDQDWYQSPFTYDEDAVEYFKSNDGSIQGYLGKVSTNTLYWDLDYKPSFKKVQEEAYKLLDKLKGMGLIDGVEVYFSGNKGVHVLLRTDTDFTPAETKRVCKGIAEEAGLSLTGEDKVIDLTVYNTNRIFRIVNTKHPASGLYKIQLSTEELVEYEESAIRELAKETQVVAGASPVDGSTLKDKYKEDTNKVLNFAALSGLSLLSPLPEDVPPVPKGKRKCIHCLEHGMFGSGERENTCIRLAAHYRGSNVDRDQAYSLINVALDRRAKRYPGINPYSSSDTYRIVDTAYSEGWIGGTYTCKTDEFLASKCSVNGVPCALHAQALSNSDTGIVDIFQLSDRYVRYSTESKDQFPKTGLNWLDTRVRIRPRNFSMINGANGSGKTSLLIQALENFNKQGLYTILFSLDMADTSLFEKLGARYTDYTQEEIESGFAKGNPELIADVRDALAKNFPYTFFDFTALASSAHIERVIREINNKLHKEYKTKLEVGIVDYAGRLMGDEQSAYANATANALAANDIAKRHDIHLMYISQVSREQGDHTQPLRTSRVAKESGAWEENATFILNCWRPFGNGLHDDIGDIYFHIYIGKNRSGKVEEGAFMWDGKRGQISEMNEEQYSQSIKDYSTAEKGFPPKMIKNAPAPTQADLVKASPHFRKKHGASNVSQETKTEELRDRPNKRFPLPSKIS